MTNDDILTMQIGNEEYSSLKYYTMKELVREILPFGSVAIEYLFHMSEFLQERMTKPHPKVSLFQCLQGKCTKHLSLPQ